MSVRIGFLAPYSSIYPSLSNSIIQGFYAALPLQLKQNNFFQFVPEFIMQGNIKTVKEAVQKLIYFNNVDILSGMISYKVLPEIMGLVERPQKMAFLFDMGEYLPFNQSVSDHFFFNSLQMWQSEYALGNWAHREFGDKGSVVMSLFDAGYHLQSAFREGTIHVGSRAIDFCVLNDNPFKSQIRQKIEQYFERIEANKPSYIHGIFCGTEAVEFLAAYNSSGLKGKVPLLITSHMASEEILSKVAHLDLKLYAASMYNYYSEDKLNQQFKLAYQMQTGQKPDIFSLLGYEMGKVFYELMPQFEKRDWKEAMRLLKKETIKTPRGERNFYLDSNYANPVIDIERIETNNKGINKIVVAEGKALHYNHHIYEEIYTQNVSGWQNPYCCV